jgi:hypothetical protein
MGKREKEHRKKVEARNNKLKGAEKMYQKMYQEMMKQHLNKLVEEHKANASGTTENGESETPQG